MTSVPPGVSVIIPTIGRPELAEAITSVRAQDYQGKVEVIVVGDLPEGTLDPKLLRGVDVTLYTGGGLKAGAARNLGIAKASHPFIALIDDDDKWRPWKLSRQMLEFEDQTADIVGTQGVYYDASTGRTSAPIPAEVKPEGVSYAEYLFRRRGTRVGRPVIFGITLVLRTELARQFPWDATLKRHQDWDWVDRMERAGARVVQIADPSAVVSIGSKGSITSSSDWVSSLAWAETRRGVWEDEILVDFIAGQVLRYAFQARSIRGIAKAIRAITRTGRAPSVQTLFLGVSGIVPRSIINRLMTR